MLPIWMREKINERPAEDNVARILQAEFKLQELTPNDEQIDTFRSKGNVFFILPKSHRAKNLMKLLTEYIHLMESTRFSRWLARIEPKDFENASLEKDLRD